MFNALKLLEDNPNKLKTKPNSIIELENALNIKASLDHDFFGCWSIFNEKYTISNNPFKIMGIFSDSADNFEVFLDDDDENVYLSTGETITKVTNFLQN